MNIVMIMVKKCMVKKVNYYSLIQMASHIKLKMKIFTNIYVKRIFFFISAVTQKIRNISTKYTIST